MSPIIYSHGMSQSALQVTSVSEWQKDQSCILFFIILQILKRFLISTSAQLLTPFGTALPMPPINLMLYMNTHHLYCCFCLCCMGSCCYYVQISPVALLAYWNIPQTNDCTLKLKNPGNWLNLVMSHFFNNDKPLPEQNNTKTVNPQYFKIMC